MKKKSTHRCQICKYLGQNYEEEATKNSIYAEAGKTIPVYLCRSHGVDLFRLGQVRFLLQYRFIFEGYYGTESEEQLMEYIKSLDKAGIRTGGIDAMPFKKQA